MAVERSSAARADAVLSAAIALASAAAFAIVQPSCLERQGDEDVTAPEARCATCHGDPSRPGDVEQRCAPPRDLLGETDPVFAGVGAHQAHLQASETHAPVACSECHLVPQTVDAPGHADDARPAEVSLGAVARTGGLDARYDARAQRCTDSWCHRQSDAIWTRPRGSAEACGSCHTLPPPPPHPASERCGACHGAVASADGSILHPELHVDGVVQLGGEGCTGCHGSGDDPAPPLDTLGNTATSAIGVGAHQAHLAGGASSRPLACEECHAVPSAVDSPGHVDAPPAEVIFSGVATTAAHEPLWDRGATSCSDSWCHGPSLNGPEASASWVETGPLGCTSCHGAPPPAPHPQNGDCSSCHGDVVADDDVTMLDRTRHVDGVVDYALEGGCTACHGSTNPAPPVDLSGSSSVTSPGVGAHQTHLAGTPRSRAVPCDECHLVPEALSSEGHVDTPPPAEVIFSGAADAYGGSPIYANGSCQSTSCHGAVFPEGHASGGSNTDPLWTVVDGTEAACGSCHALPPPAPHPKGDLNPICSACHQDIAADNATFVAPELHVDGVVTFTVP